MNKGLVIMVVVAIMGRVVIAMLGSAQDERDRYAFEKSLTAAQRMEAEKIFIDFIKMPPLTLIENKGNERGKTLALVNKKDRGGVWFHSSLNSGLKRKECLGLYDTRDISRIITPTDPEYKDKLVEFVRQE